MTGAGLILNERHRQVEQKGWTFEHDQEHANRELAWAALGYLEVVLSGRENPNDPRVLPSFWPWEASAWCPKDSAVQNLVIAGALIAAEIDRLEKDQNA